MDGHVIQFEFAMHSLLSVRTLLGDCIRWYACAIGQFRRVSFFFVSATKLEATAAKFQTLFHIRPWWCFQFNVCMCCWIANELPKQPLHAIVRHFSNWFQELICETICPKDDDVERFKTSFLSMLLPGDYHRRICIIEIRNRKLNLSQWLWLTSKPLIDWTTTTTTGINLNPKQYPRFIFI